MTDTDGRLLAVEVHAADVQDRDGAKGVLRLSRRAFPFVETVFADGGHAGRLVDWAQTKTHVTLEIVKRPRGAQGFVVIRRRWVVERTFAWIMKCRRLVRDYEQLNAVAEALITVVSCCRFRGHEDKIVTKEPERANDETEVQPRVQDRGGEVGDRARRVGGAGLP